MSVPTEKLMVASTVGQLQVGQEVDKIPLHMTVLPWFRLPVDRWPDFCEDMQDIVAETTAPRVVGGDHRVYGGHGVRLLNRASPSFNLIKGFDIHASIFRAAQNLGGDFDLTYMGLEWSPHITDTPERAIAQNEVLQLDNITILAKQALSRQKSVKAIFNWPTD